MTKNFLLPGIILCSSLLSTGVQGQSLGLDRQVSRDISQVLDVPDMAIAADGRIFNTHRSGNDIVIKVSDDHGKSWALFQTLSTPGYRFDNPSIIITGSTTADQTLFLAGIRRAAGNEENTVFLYRYNMATGALTGEPFRQSVPGNVSSCDLASGYASFGEEEGGTSISLLYATRTGKQSVLRQHTSVDGGQQFTTANTIAVSDNYFRNVAISFGNSSTASNGRYFMAWDEFTTPDAAWGKVYTARNAANVLSAATVPVCLNDVAGTANLRRPALAVSTVTDNDSGSCTAVVLAESGNKGEQASIAGFSNLRSHYTTHWGKMPLLESGTQPALTFDPASQQFAASYYDAGTQSMHLVKTGFLSTTSAAWQSIATSYADHTTSLTDPAPCIAVDPLLHQAAMSWAAADNHTICFDAEYNRAAAVLQEITAINKGRSNELTWIAGDKQDQGNVVLERSADGHTFTELTAVAQLGMPATNQYEDFSALEGMNYYRIRLGANRYSTVVSAYVDVKNPSGLDVYPNPVHRQLTVTTPDAATGAAILVYDIKGKVVARENAVRGLTSIDIGRLAPGAYLVQYVNGKENKSTRITKVLP